MLSDPIVHALLLEIVEDEENLNIIQCLIDGISTDEEIAEKTGIRLNIVRKILYKLYDKSLASYKRDKDKETQWYTYDWEFKEDEVENLKRNRLNQDLTNLKEALSNEENNMYFLCPFGHYRFNFDDASYYGFLCPECDSELDYVDNKDTVDQLKEQISFIEEELDYMDNE